MSDDEIRKQFQALAALIENVKESLERQIAEELGPMKAALERIETRLDRQGGIIQGGTRQVARLIHWSEEIDRIIAERDQRMDQFERRLSKLEQTPE